MTPHPGTLHFGIPQHRLDGPPDAPVVVLGPSLGTSSDLWLPQLPALTRRWRVLRWARRSGGRWAEPLGRRSEASLERASTRPGSAVSAATKLSRGRG